MHAKRISGVNAKAFVCFLSKENWTGSRGGPRTDSATVGQNELISGGILRGFVSQVEASYPLPLNLGGKKGNQAGIFIFGRAAFRLNSAHQITPLFLTEATGEVKLPITPLIARPSRRDLYTIGIGFDAIRLGRKVFGMDVSK